LSSVITPISAKGSTVRAWCLTALNFSPLNGAALHAAAVSSLGDYSRIMSFYNVIDCYNLTLNDRLWVSAQGGQTQPDFSMRAIPFKFNTPLPDANYKIFVNPRTVGAAYGVSSNNPVFAHALIGNQYPKTRFGFWIRFAHQTQAEPGYSTWLRGIPFAPEGGDIVNRNADGATAQLQIIVI
jgi:hypothetical protein